MTRRQQFLFRRRRFKKRLERMYRRGWAWEFIGLPNSRGYEYWSRTERTTELWHGAKQMATRTSAPTPRVQLLPPSSNPVVGYEVFRENAFNVPHVRALPPWNAVMESFLPSHLREGLYGFHRRRVFRCGHKPGRMNGFQRRCWGAGYRAYWADGFFPSWDPLERRPNESDILAGAGYYEGPFPPVPG
jgi:hypothetical protein